MNIRNAATLFDDYSWENDPDDLMTILIKCHGDVVMRFSMHEAMENAGRCRIMAHVNECDHSPWLTEWHAEAKEDLVRILKK